MPYRVVWNVINGTAGEDEGTYTWPDAVARLVDGPIPISGQHVQARIEEFTIDPESGEETIIGYPAFTVNNFTITSSNTNDAYNPENPVKPQQWGGPILYKYSSETLPEAVDAGSWAQVGIIDVYARPLGFARNFGALDLLAGSQPTSSDRSMWVNIENGHMLSRYPPTIGPWRNVGQAKGEFPSTLQGEVGSTAELPSAADVGDWYAAAGNVYQHEGNGRWTNIGPILGESQLQVGAAATAYISGYLYPRVFDNSAFKYVPRLSGGTQDTYEGEIDVKVTGWFPTTPYDPEKNIYAMDSITSVIPDDRETVTITYNLVFESDLASGTIAVYQDVYQPTYDWENLIDQLLELCYFTHGIYH